MSSRLLPMVACLLFAFSAWAYIVPDRKPALIIFTGSDWCMNCMQLEKTVLKDSLFIKYSAQNLRMYVADFPQRIRQDPDVAAKNKLLAEQYNAEGTFPKIIVVKEKKVHLIPFHRQTAAQIISEINQSLHE